MGVTASVHLKIDTGMERIGVHYYSARGLLERAAECRHVEVEGIYSHFANADAADLASARLQLERFHEVLAWYDERRARRPCGTSRTRGAILQLPESHLDMVRPGILLYGVYPSAEVRRTIDVQPALAWKSRVVYFKVVTPGHPGELRLDVADRPPGARRHRARGLRRRLLPRPVEPARVLMRGKRYPVVGRVCMDQIMVNIEWDSAYNGDEVVLLGARRRRDHHLRGPRRVGGHDPLRDPDQHQHPGAARVRVATTTSPPHAVRGHPGVCRRDIVPDTCAAPSGGDHAHRPTPRRIRVSRGRPEAVRAVPSSGSTYDFPQPPGHEPGDGVGRRVRRAPRARDEAGDEPGRIHHAAEKEMVAAVVSGVNACNY